MARKKSAKEREKYSNILKALETAYPDAKPGLDFTSPFELLIATILSAQCTDKQVNKVTPALFADYPDAKTIAQLTPEQLAADYEQKLHAARVAQNGNYYGLKGMAGDLPLEVCLWTFDGMHGVASIVGRTGHPALQGIVDSLEFYR